MITSPTLESIALDQREQYSTFGVFELTLYYCVYANEPIKAWLSVMSVIYVL